MCGECCIKYVQLMPGIDDVPSGTFGLDGFMKKKPDGTCIALEDNKCSIHERKPVACRKYECNKGNIEKS